VITDKWRQQFDLRASSETVQRIRCKQDTETPDYYHEQHWRQLH